MKQISIEATASKSTERTALSSVGSYAKIHKIDICNAITVIALVYAVLAIEADSYHLAIGAVIVSAVTLFISRKGVAQ